MRRTWVAVKEGLTLRQSELSCCEGLWRGFNRMSKQREFCTNCFKLMENFCICGSGDANKNL